MADQKNDSKFDYERASTLLGIVEKVAGVAPGFVYLSNEAMTELREMNDYLGQVAKDRGEAQKAKDDAVRAENARVAKAQYDDEVAKASVAASVKANVPQPAEPTPPELTPTPIHYTSDNPQPDLLDQAPVVVDPTPTTIADRRI